MKLLPGIPDDITLAHITPKLPWRTLHVLSSASRPWRQAIQSRLVYDARVRAHSTETLIVHNHYYGSYYGETQPTREAIALYSTSDERCYELPPIPDLERGIPGSCQCLALDGRIYILGGEHHNGDFACAEVYVLDVAGHRQWEQCAGMEEPRQSFGSGVVEGKIYVFGGDNSGRPCECEVYDPNVNTWSPIMRMPLWREAHHVAAVGEELFVCGGDVYDPDYYEVWETALDYYGDASRNYTPRDDCLEVYNTVKDEWRIIDTVERSSLSVFMAKGNLHGMSRLGIDVYDNDKNAWVNRWTNSFPGIGPTDPSTGSFIIESHAPLLVNDDLFVRVSWYCQNELESSFDRAELLQSKGFENENKELVWQKTNCSFAYDSSCGSSVIYAIQL